jgi:hypothetical protein
MLLGAASMRRLIISFALANLSLLSAYLIAATWPDKFAPTKARVATVGDAPASVAALTADAPFATARSDQAFSN